MTAEVVFQLLKWVFPLKCFDKWVQQTFKYVKSGGIMFKWRKLKSELNFEKECYLAKAALIKRTWVVLFYGGNLMKGFKLLNRRNLS